MSVFFVGMKVRIVQGGYVDADGLKAVGKEGRITEKLHHQVVDWMVRVESGEGWCCSETCLEPILPSGHQPAEESLEELLPFLKEKKAIA